MLDISTGLQKHFQDPLVFKEIVEYVEAKIGGKNIHPPYLTFLHNIPFSPNFGISLLINYLGKLQLEEKKTLQQGCSTTLVAALDPSITGNVAEFAVS